MKTNRRYVYLVGAGPGDKQLITVAGMNCIAQADVIIYDHLLSPSILQYKKPAARLIYVGKTPQQHSFSQEKINRLLVDEAKKNNVVVRLKGGDPFLFGRGSEEALFLAKTGIPFEIIPGVSSGFAVAAYAGIPLTHRGISSQVIFVTGHEDPKKARGEIDWMNLARYKGTLVILMGMGRLKSIVDILIKNGMNKSTPVCVVQWGTLPRQRSVVKTLKNITKAVEDAQIANPAVVIIGEVVKLRKEINWFEKKPLFGKRILITRPLPLIKDFSEKLEGLGAEVISFPLIEIVPRININGERFLKMSRDCDWLLFTSRNAVDICFNFFRQKNIDARFLHKTKIAALGEITQESLRQKGINTDLVPAKYAMEDLIAEFKPINLKGKKIFIPHSRQGRKILVEALRKRGAEVEEMFVYTIRLPVVAKASKLKRLLKNNVDLITFTSSSCVINFMQLLGQDTVLLKNKIFAAIGPITAKTLKSYGFRTSITARDYTVSGLCQAIQDYYIR